MLTAVVVFGVTLTGFGETVTNVRGSQRPNSKLVDIYYDLNATDGGTYTVEVAIEGRTNEVTATTFSGDVGKGVAPGKNRHIVWEAGADWRGKKGDVKAVVTAAIEAKNGKPKKVQLWAGGPYWADRNVGASSPEDYGLYFWWGDTTGHRPSGGSFSFNFGSSNPELRNVGLLTKNGVLAPEHDAAHVKWGGGWRMPTYQEQVDLCYNYCDWHWTTMNGVKGYVVRGRGAYASASIFLPAAGYGEGTLLNLVGEEGNYWSSVPNSGNHPWMLYFWDGTHYVYSGYRHLGFSVRPVQGSTK